VSVFEWVAVCLWCDEPVYMVVELDGTENDSDSCVFQFLLDGNSIFMFVGRRIFQWIRHIERCILVLPKFVVGNKLQGKLRK